MAFWNSKTDESARPKGRSVRRFFAAITGRMTGDWIANLLTPDEEVEADVETMRARSRELVRNNAYAQSFMRLLKVYIIGSEGIVAQPTIRNEDGTLDEDQNKIIKTAWMKWGRNVTLDGRSSLQETANLAIQTLATDGEIFIRKIRDAKAPFGCYLQLIDADFLDINNNHNKLRNGNHVIQGVEMDDNRKVVAYHFFSRAPTDTLTPVRDKRKKVRVLAADIIHIYRQDRPNQTRGVPWMHSVMYSIRMLGEAKRYELIASRVAAGKMGFIEKTAEMAPDELDDDLNSDKELDDPQQRQLPGGPGEIGELDFGETFKSWDPQHPNNAFEAFTRLELRTIASGLGVSYGSLSSDLSDTSYSSGRIGSVLERDFFRALQMWFAQIFYNAIYEEWVEVALLSGDLKLKSRNPDDYRGWDKMKWQPRGFLWIDPEKDLKAFERAIANGLADRTSILNSLGQDISETFRNLAAEQELAEELGIDVDGVMGAPAEEDLEKKKKTGD